MFYNQSVVRSPQSLFYADRCQNVSRAMRTAGRLRHCGLQITKWKRFIDVFLSPCNLEGIRRAYPINYGVCSWYTAMNVSLFDGLWSYENIGPRRKHVKIILLHSLLWFPMRSLGQLWTCKNRFAFRFDFGVKCFWNFFHLVLFTQILHVILRQYIFFSVLLYFLYIKAFSFRLRWNKNN